MWPFKLLSCQESFENCLRSLWPRGHAVQPGSTQESSIFLTKRSTGTSIRSFGLTERALIGCWLLWVAVLFTSARGMAAGFVST
jgi:hypothetical protein